MMGFFSSIAKAVAPSVVSGAFGLFGASRDRGYASDAADREAQVSREIAQNQIRWRVADAKAAGVHPLYAIGAPSFSAPSISAFSPGYGKAFGDMGQDLGRAITAAMSSKERAEEKRIARLSAMQNYQRGELENQRLATEVALMQRGLIGQTQLPPSGPSALKVENVPEQVVPPPELIEGQGTEVPWPWSGSVPSTANRPSQQTIEDMYGGAVGEIYGFGWKLHDLVQQWKLDTARMMNQKYGLRTRWWQPPRPKRKPRRVGNYSRYE
jgi:hypothetical protein